MDVPDSTAGDTIRTTSSNDSRSHRNQRPRCSNVSTIGCNFPLTLNDLSAIEDNVRPFGSHVSRLDHNIWPMDRNVW